MDELGVLERRGTLLERLTFIMILCITYSDTPLRHPAGSFRGVRYGK